MNIFRDQLHSHPILDMMPNESLRCLRQTYQLIR